MKATKETALYGALAKYYDRIYYWKDYKKEAAVIKALIRRYKRSSGSSLLDVACGTGKHISYLRRDFDCFGVDASAQMLTIARKNAPGVKFARADMLDFDIGREFDVVLCLFSSIGHLKTRSEVKKAVANLARHTKRGGVVIIEPWLRKSEWSDKKVHMQRFESDALKIARVNFGRSEGAFSLIDEAYLIGERDKGITYFKDLLKLRFFERGPTLAAMRKAGLTPIFIERSLMPGRGLIVATKP